MPKIGNTETKIGGDTFAYIPALKDGVLREYLITGFWLATVGYFGEFSVFVMERDQ